MACSNCGSKNLALTRERYSYEQESGLPNVVLDGIEVRRCRDCGAEDVVIPRVAELHRVIARNLIERGAPGTGAELRFLRKHMGFSAADFAVAIDYDPATVSRWENERQPIPAVVQVAVREMVRSGRTADEYLQPIAAPGVASPIVLSMAARQWTSAAA